MTKRPERERERPRPEAEGADERRFTETVRALLNTPPKPHKGVRKATATRAREKRKEGE